MNKGGLVLSALGRGLCILGLGVGLMVPPSALAEQGAAPPSLTSADCIKCHQKETAEIVARGGSHKTELSCQSCHESHRPMVANNIPQCSMCHSGEAHFQAKGCSGCHNPHEPLDITLKGQFKKVCLTCHPAQGKELAAHPSKHSGFACNFCHANKHGTIPACTDCHESHSNKITPTDCKNCHKAHMPLALNYGDDVPSIQCAACHKKVYTELVASKSKHHGKACVFCHAGRHKVIPECSDCHGLPHAPEIHKKFPKCGECHHTAHDLNNWPTKKKTWKTPQRGADSRDGGKK